MYIYRIKKIITKNNIMTIQDKLRKKGFQLGVTINGGIRTGYYATNRAYGTKTRIYKTQIELLNAIK